MLDECKGDKFFEILALFSTAVLKKSLASRRRDTAKTAVARKLATAVTLPGGHQESLLPLAVAHKAALVNILKRKDEKRRHLAQFERVLNQKQREISQRIRKCKDTPRAQRPAVAKKEADAIKKQLRDNWVGNHKWLDVMLYGDHVQADDAFLSSSFNKVWNMVEKGCKPEDVAPETGLLQDLQSRVEEQQTRMQRWRLFHDKMQQEEPSSSSDSRAGPLPAKEFRFDSHLSLQLRSMIPAHEPVNKLELRPEYQDILEEMHDELSRVASAKHDQSFVTLPRRRGSSLGASRSPLRRRQSRSDSLSKVPPSPPKTSKAILPCRKQSREAIPQRPLPRSEATATTPIDSEATLVGPASTFHPTTLHSTEPRVQQQRRSEPVEETSDPLPLVTSRVHTSRPIEPPSPSPSPSPPPTSYLASEPPVLDPAPLDLSEALAAQIVSSIGDATPSPIKRPQPRLSLLERTRLSMAHMSTFPAITESPQLPSPPLPSPPPAEPAPADAPALAQTLIERTRLSMAARPRASLAPREKRKSTAGPRRSFYPVNQFDTPRNRRSFQAIEDAKSGEHTPKEDLFGDDADYDRVFKSRPRVATSPTWGTPGDGQTGESGETEEGFDEGVTGLDLADVDADEDEEGFTQVWENSPLRRVGKGRMMN